MKILILSNNTLNLSQVFRIVVGSKVIDFYNAKNKGIFHAVFKSVELAERAFDQINDYAVAQNQSEALDLTEWLEMGDEGE